MLAWTMPSEEEKGGVASNGWPEAGVVTQIFTVKPYL